MAVPFRLEPESNDRREPDDRREGRDPFLEFESERPVDRPADQPSDPVFQRPSDRLTQRPSRSGLFTHPPLDPPEVPVASQPSLRSGAPFQRMSSLSPSLAFALGVGGLVTAIVAYYQMGQLLQGRAALATNSTVAVDAPTAAGSAPVAGRLEVTSEPAGAPVFIDGTSRGVTPLSLAGLAPGRHEVRIGRGARAVTKRVELASGSTAFVTAVIGSRAEVAAPPALGASTSSSMGWVTFEAPIELRILDGGRPRGTTGIGRVPLREGHYDFELVNETLEVRQIVSASVVAGQGSRIAVPIPSGTLSVNALPWADVWIDGAPIGTTPLANISVPVGTRQIVWRHPTLGERQQTVIVKARTPARIGVNLNR